MSTDPLLDPLPEPIAVLDLYRRLDLLCAPENEEQEAWWPKCAELFPEQWVSELGELDWMGADTFAIKIRQKLDALRDAVLRQAGGQF